MTKLWPPPAGTATTFYLGCPEPHWLELVDVPLFVSHNRLSRRVRLPKARGPWALDSGGFTELQRHGRWRIGPDAYIDAVRRYRDEIGHLVWAAPQDWMCEPIIINGGRVGHQVFVGTHLTVAEHQRRTVENFVYLRNAAPDLPFIPVLQGWTLDDYLACIELYEQAGVDLTAYPVVGVGSVCRRQATGEIGDITGALTARGLRLHGFGVKSQGLERYSGNLVSADSQAWSRAARWEPKRAGCKHRAKNCASCLDYALAWRSGIVGGPVPVPVEPERVTKPAGAPAGPVAPTLCGSCREPVPVQATGRPARYCSQRCRQAAYRARTL